MPDTTHWIVVRGGSTPDLAPYEIENKELEAHLRSHGECIHLVPTRVWRDWQQTLERLQTIHAELKTYNKATFVVQAAKRGDPMPTKVPRG